MGLMDFKNAENFAQLQAVERTAWSALAPFRNGRTEAILVVFALLRIARRLLELYPEKDQQIFRPLTVAFMRGDTSAPGVASDSPLWTPPNIN